MKKKSRPLADAAPPEGTPEPYVNNDFNAASRIVEKYGIDGTGIPSEAAIRVRAEEHRHSQRTLDLDAAAWVYKRVLEASRDEEMGKLIRDTYRKRQEMRAYTSKAPFSALLIANFTYEEHRASKIGVYLRAALHRDWSVQKLRREMKARWYIKKSAEEAQNYLAEQAELKRRSKKTSDEAATKKSRTASSITDPNNAADTEDAEIKIYDLDETSFADPNDEYTDDGSVEVTKYVRIYPPRRQSQVGERIFIEVKLKADGEYAQIGWYTPKEMRQRLRQGAGKSGIRRTFSDYVPQLRAMAERHGKRRSARAKC